MKLPVIDGKEVVPVRLIPFITQRRLGQQILAKILTHRYRVDGFPERQWVPDERDIKEPEGTSLDEILEGGDESDAGDGEIIRYLSSIDVPMRETVDGITGEADDDGVTYHCVACVPVINDVLPSKSSKDFHAYLLNHAGEPVRMLTTEWDQIVREMEPVEPLLRKEEEENGVENSREQEWIGRTLKMLPESAFMWREDFECLWRSHIISYLRLPGERDDERRFNYDAHIPTEFRNVVQEGLETLLSFANTCLAAPVDIPDASAAEDAEQMKEETSGEKPKGGRPPGYLMEALEHTYLTCLERGDTSILEARQLQAFLKHIQKLSGGSREKEQVSEYISERIALVQPSNLAECIKTHDCAIEGKKYREGRWYSQHAVSGRMNTLREKYPLPLQKNIQESVVSESENRGL